MCFLLFRQYESVAGDHAATDENAHLANTKLLRGGVMPNVFTQLHASGMEPLSVHTLPRPIAISSGYHSGTTTRTTTVGQTLI